MSDPAARKDAHNLAPLEALRQVVLDSQVGDEVRSLEAPAFIVRSHDPQTSEDLHFGPFASDVDALVHAEQIAQDFNEHPVTSAEPGFVPIEVTVHALWPPDG